MARPTKKGLDYFPQDTDIHNDIKIRRLRSEFGATGYLVYDYIKCLCYKENGYWVGYDDRFCFDVADVLQSGLTENSVLEILKGCFRCQLFNTVVFKAFRVITSSGIQKRFLLAKRGGVIDEKYKIINESLVITVKTATKEKESKVNNLFTEIEPYTDSQRQAFNDFKKWIETDLPGVYKMDKPLTITEYLKLKGELGTSKGIAKEQIIKILRSIENNTAYLKKYRSPYLCILNWSKNEK